MANSSKGVTSKLKILIGQTKPESDKSLYYELAKKFSVELFFTPFIDIQPLTIMDFKKQQIDLKEYTSIIFTTKNSLEFYFKTCKELKIKINAETKYFCLREEIAVLLNKYIVYRKRKIFVTEDGINAQLFEKFAKGFEKNEKVLYNVSQNQQDMEIVRWLYKYKINYSITYMYKTIFIDCKTIFAEHNFNIICFFTPSAINSLYHNIPKYKQEKTIIGTFGENTLKVAKVKKMKVLIQAPIENVKTIYDALYLFLNKLNFEKSKKSK